MPIDLRDQLQSAFGASYAIERELGGGGMSRVFVATETALGRKVVVKVLPPELAAELSVERFRREIALAAQMRHPHVVPVLAAGEAGTFLYYTMPYVEGESLRARLARDGELPLGEAVRLIREMADALAYAHRRGVVHRDVKPENILLGEGHAAVADFGIAKALTTAAGGSLTATGLSVGTPAYMAPEQAAGDAGIDHRADLYSLGVVAYEMLTGEPPFHGRTAQALVAAHLTQSPPAVTARRPAVPPPLGALVMRLLEKRPADRPQSADEVVRALDAAALGTDGSGVAFATPPAPTLGGRRALARALALYAAAFLAVAVLARLAIAAIGLPDWVFPGALIVMALGLPVILVTALAHREAPPPRPELTGAPLAALAVRARPHVSWRRTAWGGAAALGFFVVLVAGYMVLRALGIGPAGSLLAAGKLKTQDRVLVADFRAGGPDSALGNVVAEAVRANLSQSAVVSVVPASAVAGALGRMQRPTTSRLDLPLAREVAAREGIKAVVDGEIRQLGAGFILSVRLVAAESGDELASFHETGNGPNDLIPAIDRAVRRLRGKMGESLKAVRDAPPLDQVTTPSLAALRKYALGSREIATGADPDHGIALLEEAIALDSGFAMAYRRISAELFGRPGQNAHIQELISKAYDHRDRLTDVERDLTTAMYFTNGPTPDEDKALAAYEDVLSLQPDNTTALNNAALLYMERRDYAKAAELTARALAVDSSTITFYGNLQEAQLELGRVDDARRTMDAAARHVPNQPFVFIARAAFAIQEGLFDSAAAVAQRSLLASSSPFARGAGGFILSRIAMIRGRLADAQRYRRGFYAVRGVGRQAWAGLSAALDDAFDAAWFLDDRARALRTTDSTLARYPLDSIAPADRPYALLVRVYSLAGRPDRARAMLADLDRSRAGGLSRLEQAARHRMLGDIALAERRFPDAIAEYRASDYGPCRGCALPDIARAYDLAGNADSALALFTRFLENRDFERDRTVVDGVYHAGAVKRAAELYEAKGDRPKAAEYYARFVDLWQRADPALQPKVAEARRRLASLSDVERR